MIIKIAATEPITQTCSQAKAFGTRPGSIRIAVVAGLAPRPVVIDRCARKPAIKAGR
jgi:hypothetical protein